MRKARRFAAASVLAIALMAAVPSSAIHPPVVAGTFGAWAPAAFAVNAGETVNFVSADLPHTFVTDGPLCVGNLGPRNCDEFIAGLGSTPVRIHNAAPKGTHQFRCGFHTWMRGVIVVN